MAFTVADTPKKNHPILGGIAFAGCLATAMLVLQNNITDYKTLSSHFQEVTILNPTDPVQASARCAILSGELQTTGPAIEPLLHAKVPDTAALWVTEENFSYRRHTRRGWQKTNTLYSEAPDLMIGPYKLTLGFLNENGRIPHIPMELEGQDFAHTFAENNHYSISHQYLYTEGLLLENTPIVHGDKRFGYSSIPANQPITVLGDVTTSGHDTRPLIIPCHELSSTYPAIWPGILGREEILSIFQTRMVNTLLGLWGMIFLLSAALMIRSHFRSPLKSKLSDAGAFMHIFVAGNASIAIYFTSPEFVIVFPATFIAYLLSSFIYRKLFGP